MKRHEATPSHPDMRQVLRSGWLPALWVMAVTATSLILREAPRSSSHWALLDVLSVAPIAIVAALRETSVLFGAKDGQLFPFRGLTKNPELRARISEVLGERYDRLVDWLDAYHARVRKTLSPLADPKTRAWLRGATRKLLSD